MAPEGREFRLSPKAEPVIDSITLSIVKEDG
jgi:hypothetical protein